MGFQAGPRLAAVMVVVVGVAACTTNQNGTVTGIAAPCAGVAPRVQFPQLSVRVTLLRGQLVVATQVVQGRATYSLSAPAGSYLLASDQMTKAARVEIVAGATARLDLIPVCK